MKLGDRVYTPHGLGTIKVIETFCDKHPRAGVLHDVYPAKFPKFTNDLLYYFLTELKLF